MDMNMNNTGGMERKPRNVFEQLAFALETVNNNIIDLYNMVREIHDDLYAIRSSEPNAPGTEAKNDTNRGHQF